MPDFLHLTRKIFFIVFFGKAAKITDAQVPSLINFIHFIITRPLNLDLPFVELTDALNQAEEVLFFGNFTCSLCGGKFLVSKTMPFEKRLIIVRHLTRRSENEVSLFVTAKIRVV